MSLFKKYNGHFNVSDFSDTSDFNEFTIYFPFDVAIGVIFGFLNQKHLIFKQLSVSVLIFI